METNETVTAMPRIGYKGPEFKETTTQTNTVLLLLPTGVRETTLMFQLQDPVELLKREW